MCSLHIAYMEIPCQLPLTRITNVLIKSNIENVQIIPLEGSLCLVLVAMRLIF